MKENHKTKIAEKAKKENPAASRRHDIIIGIITFLHRAKNYESAIKQICNIIPEAYGKPQEVFVNSSGDIYITDTDNNGIRKIWFFINILPGYLVLF